MEDTCPTEDQEIEALRKIILGGDKARIAALEQALNNPEEFARLVSDILPQSLRASAQKDTELAQALVPTVENIVRLSIKKDINKFADALFPVIGPAIRKSIHETLRQMLQSMNQLLDSTLSWQGLKWRLESLRTGIPFAQIVILKSMLYRVEQVFLIHRETGLLLQHMEIEQSVQSKADLVSSMLTAIGDFVKDSFNQAEDQELGSIQVGGLALWIEQSPSFTLALAINGDAPHALRTTMQQTIETIQRDYTDSLANFNGDTTPFEGSRELLSSCMLSQVKQAEQKSALKPRLITAGVLALLLYWLGTILYTQHVQNSFIESVKREPGYLVTAVETNGKHLTLQGLRDPLSAEIEAVATHAGFDPQNLTTQFQPYHSLEHSLLLKRIRRLIQAPENIQLAIDADQLFISGYADQQWLNSLELKKPFIPAISEVIVSVQTSIDLSPLTPPTSAHLLLDINQGVLRVTGEAPHNWKEQVIKFSSTHPGIRSTDFSELKTYDGFEVFNPPQSVQMVWSKGTLVITGEASHVWIQQFIAQVASSENPVSYDSTQLIDTDYASYTANIDRLEALNILFNVYSSTPVDNTTIRTAETLSASISEQAKRLGETIIFDVYGYSDSTGNKANNLALRSERADYVVTRLIESGIAETTVNKIALQNEAPPESNETERKLNRKAVILVRSLTDQDSP